MFQMFDAIMNFKKEETDKLLDRLELKGKMKHEELAMEGKEKIYKNIAWIWFHHHHPHWTLNLWRKVWSRSKGKTLLGLVNKLFCFQTPSNVLPNNLK